MNVEIMKKPKVSHALLLHPPFFSKDDLTSSMTPHMPLGLAYIGGSLHQAGYSVSVIDAFVEGYESITRKNDFYIRGLTPTEVCNRVEKLRPDVILLSIPFTIQAMPALHLACQLKGQFPWIPIIIGGPHATTAAESIIALPYVDIVVRGEGEHAIVDIMDRLKNGRDMKGIPGVLYRDIHGKIHNNGKAALIDDLDALPFPLWDAFDHKRIHKLRNDKSITVITSRGCPYSCCFCSIEQVMGRKFRARSPENVIAEIDRIVTEYDINTIYFEDDNLAMDKERCKKLFQMMIERDYGITWFPRNGIRMETLDHEILQLMRRSGCGRVWIAPESGSLRILQEVINKRLDIEHVYKVAKMILDEGIPVTCFFVVGFPQETHEDLEMTFKMALELKKLGVDDFWFSCAMPYLGTKLFDMCCKLKPHIDWNSYLMEFSTHFGIIDSQDYCASEIQRLRESAMQLLNTTSKNQLPKIEDIFKSLDNKPVMGSDG